MAEQKLKGSTVGGMAVLVTGGGTGIGAACALRMAQDGAAVTICGRTESKLEDAASRIEAAAAAAGKGGAFSSRAATSPTRTTSSGSWRRPRSRPAGSTAS